MASKKKVLIIRFSSIGDIVLTTPVVRCLGKVPGKDIEVHYVTKKDFLGVLNSNPYIHKVYVLDGSLFCLIRLLRKEQFDYIIDLHHNIRSAIIKLSLGRPSSAFRKLNPEKWFLTRLKINRLPDVHIVDRYLEAAKSLDVKNDGEGLDYFLPEDARVAPEALPSAFGNGFMTFVIGGKHATKRLPNEKIISICRKLNVPVILLGGKDDAPNGAAIASACTPLVFNACGMFPLNQSAYLVKKSRVVITHDTGLMHVAAAFNKPVISIWGNTIPEFGMYPYMPQNQDNSHIVQVKGLSCRPCSKIGYNRCPQKHFDCMMKIDEDRIVNTALQIMQHTSLEKEV